MLYNRGKGRYNKQYGDLWDQLVPKSGQAITTQGELVRTIGRLASEFYRNGNGYWDMGFRMYTNFLNKYLLDKRFFDAETIRQIKQDITEIRDFGSGKKGLEYTGGEDAFDRLTDRVVEWCQQNPELIKRDRDPKLKR